MIAFASQVNHKMATTDAILAGKYPAKAHARRVAGYLQERGYDGPGVIYLEAQRTRLIEDNDEAMPFRYHHPLRSTESVAWILTTAVSLL